MTDVGAVSSVSVHHAPVSGWTTSTAPSRAIAGLVRGRVCTVCTAPPCRYPTRSPGRVSSTDPPPPAGVLSRAPVGRSTSVPGPPVNGQYRMVRVVAINTTTVPSMRVITGPNRGAPSTGAAKRVRPSGSSTDSHRSFGPTRCPAVSVVLRSCAVITAVTPVPGSVTGTVPSAIGSTHAACCDQPGGPSWV